LNWLRKDHLGEYDGWWIHIDESFFGTAPNPALKLLFLHEVAHMLGYEHGDVGEDVGTHYNEFPFMHLEVVRQPGGDYTTAKVNGTSQCIGWTG
jgi:hypothetical protein